MFHRCILPFLNDLGESLQLHVPESRYELVVGKENARGKHIILLFDSNDIFVDCRADGRLGACMQRTEHSRASAKIDSGPMEFV
jgi:hypothetical protein